MLRAIHRSSTTRRLLPLSRCCDARQRARLSHQATSSCFDPTASPRSTDHDPTASPCTSANRTTKAKAALSPALWPSATPPTTTMSDSSAVVVSTSLVALISGFMLGIYSSRGYLITPALVAERQRNLCDPVESDESDVDEQDTILDHAPNWSNGEEADRIQGLRASGGAKKTKAGDAGDAKRASLRTPLDEALDKNPNEECKLVLVVRTDLGMSKGKIAAQCSHATLACYRTLLRAAQRSPTAARLLERWERHGQAKIALQAKGEDELAVLMGTARSLGVTAEMIADAGRTQIEAGTRTVLGVGPAPKSLVDKVTGHFKLL